MVESHRTTAPNRLFLPVLALAAAGIAVILLSGSLGAATSGRGFLQHWLGTSGQGRDNLTRAPDLPKILGRSGA